MTDSEPDEPTYEGEQGDRSTAEASSGDPPWGVDPTDASSVDALDAELLEALGVPEGRAATGIDVREAPPPEPLTRTLETLESIPDATVLLQRNDRVPVHLFDQLDERGYRHATAERADEVLTAIWRE
ncbi:DUF2249 domain-containing protein [Halobaculum sp. EA56]|uniref:DUF2249 domain-containing protein n=1 Tax=Halobaculum sp. EA56 TaxID=3421648 RepID=UPI003EB6E540